MHQKLVFNTHSGPVKLCSVWEFLPDVRVQRCAQFRDAINEVRRRELEIPKYTPTEQDFVMSSAVHKLTQNPMKLITELKKTTTPIRFERKIQLSGLIQDVAYHMYSDLGRPTHIFSVGKDKFAIVGVEDMLLVVTEKFDQQLICTRPHRNFVIHAKNLEFA